MAEERHQHQSDYPYHEQRVEWGKVVYETVAAGYENGKIVHPSSRIDYQYDGEILIGETITARDEDGNIVSSVSYEWSTEEISQKIHVRRKVRL
jgi:hypothetical protein